MWGEIQQKYAAAHCGATFFKIRSALALNIRIIDRKGNRGGKETQTSLDKEAYQRQERNRGNTNDQKRFNEAGPRGIYFISTRRKNS